MFLWNLVWGSNFTNVFITRWCSSPHIFAATARTLQLGRILCQCDSHWIALWHSILISQLKDHHTSPGYEWNYLWMHISLSIGSRWFHLRAMELVFWGCCLLYAHYSWLGWSIFCNWAAGFYDKRPWSTWSSCMILQVRVILSLLLLFG